MLSTVFAEFLRLSDEVQFIAWHGIQLYGFSAVKVKLVDSLI